MHQGYLIKKINNIYGKQVKGLTDYKITGTPRVGLVHPNDKNEVVSKEDHQQYRYGVGMLLYLVKQTQPDIANAVRGLTRLNYGPT